MYDDVSVRRRSFHLNRYQRLRPAHAARNCKHCSLHRSIIDDDALCVLAYHVDAAYSSMNW